MSKIKTISIGLGIALLLFIAGTFVGYRYRDSPDVDTPGMGRIADLEGELERERSRFAREGAALERERISITERENTLAEREERHRATEVRLAAERAELDRARELAGSDRESIDRIEDLLATAIRALSAD